jgi:hypothetical protein
MLKLNRRRNTTFAPAGAGRTARPPHRFDALRVTDHSTYDQSTARDRRRKGLPVAYGPAFVLSAELAAVLSGPAARIAGDPTPARWVRRIGRALAPTGHDDTLPTSVADAVASIARVIGAAVPALPEPTAETVADGSWAAEVADTCRTLDEPLSAALRRGVTRGGDRITDHLTERLREIDRAAHALDVALDRVAVTDTAPPVSAARRHLDAVRARHRAELAAMEQRHRAELRAARHG